LHQELVKLLKAGKNRGKALDLQGDQGNWLTEQTNRKKAKELVNDGNRRRIRDLLETYKDAVTPERFEKASKKCVSSNKDDDRHYYPLVRFRIDDVSQIQHTMQLLGWLDQAEYQRVYRAVAVVLGANWLERIGELLPQARLMKWIRIVHVLEDNLETGGGTDCAIDFNDRAKRVDPKHPKPASKDDYYKEWWHRPVEVGLAHELIHAWRFLTGRCICSPRSWEDEAMTIGVNPFIQGRFTENKIREELGRVSRPESYGTRQYNA
jgi:hypothetical protein